MPRLGHVLVVRTDHLGDMLLTLPMCSALKRADPSCRVSVLASAHGAPIARLHPDVDAVEVDPLAAKHSGLRGVRALSQHLRRLGCDSAVVVHPTPRLALAVWLGRIPIRVGSGYRAYSVLFNRRVYEHRRRPPWKHESEHNLRLLKALGVDAGAAAAIAWRIDPGEMRIVESLLRDAGVAGQLAVLHPGSAGSAMNWSPQQYIDLGRRLVGCGVRVAVTGGPGEVDLTRTVTAGIGAGAFDLGGRLSLPQLAALLGRCNLYIGSSTGPTHLAAMVGAPVVGLYSPLRSSLPVRWRPLGPSVRVLQPAVDIVCPRCLGERCPYYHCMEARLSVDAVAEAAAQLLRGAQSAK